MRRAGDAPRTGSFPDEIARRTYPPERPRRQIGVYKVEAIFVGQLREHRVIPAELHGVPADVGHQQPFSIRCLIGKALDPSWKNSETGGHAVFVALVEEHLEAQAEPEVGAPRRKPIANRIVQTGLGQACHGIREGTDTRKHDAIGAAHDRGVCGDIRIQTGPLQRLRNTA